MTEAQIEAETVKGEIEAMFFKMNEKIKVEEIGEVSGDMNKQALFNLLKECTVNDAGSYLQGLINAFNYHVRERNKEVLVKDLGIKLLE